MESIYGQKINELAEAEYKENRSIFIEETKGADSEILRSLERRFTGTGFTEDGCKDNENYL